MNETLLDTPSEFNNYKKRSKHAYLKKILNAKELCDFKGIHKYFKSNPDKITIMTDILNKTSKISLRILDWFVTRYADINKTNYKLDNKEIFYVHISYKSQLKAYTKKRFDPFRRRQRFDYYYTDENGSNKSIQTTLGQLNFFRWVTINKIVDYVDINYDKIVRAMNTSNKENKKVRQKKKEVSVTKIKKNGNEVAVNIEKETDSENRIVDLRISFDNF